MEKNKIKAGLFTVLIMVLLTGTVFGIIFYPRFLFYLILGVFGIFLTVKIYKLVLSNLNNKNK